MDVYDILRERLDAEQILLNEPMKNHTTFRVGGLADVFVMPKNTGEVLFVLQTCRGKKMPCFVLGNGSNLLVADEGIRGVVISLKNLTEMKLVDDDTIYAGAGCLLPDISKFAREHSLSGLEFAEGIPGSLGGGIAMNAVAYEGEIKQFFRKAHVIDQNCQLCEIELDGMEFAYRQSAVQRDGLTVCSAILGLAGGNAAEISAKMANYRRRRMEKQPLEMPSAGSTFKRPPGHFAGKLIMDAGLRGFAIGGAQVSEKHCGFIINRGGATAADILALAAHVQQVVKDKFDVVLELEVKIIGGG